MPCRPRERRTALQRSGGREGAKGARRGPEWEGPTAEGLLASMVAKAGGGFLSLPFSLARALSLPLPLFPLPRGSAGRRPPSSP
eukprot:scaffold230502_cov29-Tisochrysis_lutea.AAC.3